MKIVSICSTLLIAATLCLSALAADDENFWMTANRGSLAVGAFFTDETFLSRPN